MLKKFQQRVLVIQDASKELRTNGIRAALQGIPFKPGDTIRLLVVVQPFSTPTASCFLGCGILPMGFNSKSTVGSNTGLYNLIKNLGYKSKLHSSATIMKKQEDIEKEIEKKMEEYRNNAEIKELERMYEMQQIALEIAVEAGHSLNKVVVQAASNLEATCVILDRQMKINQRYLLGNLSSAILIIRHDCSVQHVREMKAAETPNTNIEETSLIRNQPEDVLGYSVGQACRNKRPMFGFSREFTYKELQDATNGFSPQSFMPEQGKGIYKGQLADGQLIIVREHSYFSNMVRNNNSANIKWDKFKSEVQILQKARHENVAMLLGSCSELGRRLLVYEYVCNGSLDIHLSKRSRDLTWERRMTIAMGTAKGLRYLHSNEIYGNIRPSNIVITHDHQPLITNFGLTRNQYEESDHSSGTRVMRTFEYVAPEFEETGKHSSESDIYSFGVVLLELITGRRTVKETNGQSFLRWARPLLEDKIYQDLIDPRLEDSLDLHQLFWMVHLVHKCLDWDPSKRYSIDRVTVVLTCITQGCSVKDFSPAESDLIKQIMRRDEQLII